MKEPKIYFSETDKTIDSWTGGQGFYNRLLTIKIFGFMFVLWKMPKFINVTKDQE